MGLMGHYVHIMMRHLAIICIVHVIWVHYIILFYESNDWISDLKIPLGMESFRQGDCYQQVSQDYPFVAAIDFGTVYSGYAFLTITDPNKISMNKNWSGGAFEAYKTPTSVLFGPTGFKEFGYPAEKE